MLSWHATCHRPGLMCSGVCDLPALMLPSEQPGPEPLPVVAVAVVAAAVGAAADFLP